MEKEAVIHEWEEFRNYLARENRYVLIPKWKNFVKDIPACI